MGWLFGLSGMILGLMENGFRSDKSPKIKKRPKKPKWSTIFNLTHKQWPFHKNSCPNNRLFTSTTRSHPLSATEKIPIQSTSPSSSVKWSVSARHRDFPFFLRAGAKLNVRPWKNSARVRCEIVPKRKKKRAKSPWWPVRVENWKKMRKNSSKNGG